MYSDGRSAPGMLTECERQHPDLVSQHVPVQVGSLAPEAPEVGQLTATLVRLMAECKSRWSLHK